MPWGSECTVMRVPTSGLALRLRGSQLTVKVPPELRAQRARRPLGLAGTRNYVSLTLPSTVLVPRLTQLSSLGLGYRTLNMYRVDDGTYAVRPPF